METHLVTDPNCSRGVRVGLSCHFVSETPHGPKRAQQECQAEREAVLIRDDQVGQSSALRLGKLSPQELPTGLTEAEYLWLGMNMPGILIV